jgi:predicted ATPase
MASWWYDQEMFIRRFAIRNFKIHKDTALNLFPITVLVGPNSRGQVGNLRRFDKLFDGLSG